MTLEARPADLPPEKPAHRSTTLTRRALGAYTATNARGGTVAVGGGEDEFTAVELLLAGIAACTAVDVDHLTSRRAEPDDFEIRVDAQKVADEQGNHLQDVVVTFRIRYPEGEGVTGRGPCCPTSSRSRTTASARSAAPSSWARRSAR